MAPINSEGASFLVKDIRQKTPEEQRATLEQLAVGRMRRWPAPCKVPVPTVHHPASSSSFYCEQSISRFSNTIRLYWSHQYKTKTQGAAKKHQNVGGKRLRGMFGPNNEGGGGCDREN